MCDDRLRAERTPCWAQDSSDREEGDEEGAEEVRVARAVDVGGDDGVHAGQGQVDDEGVADGGDGRRERRDDLRSTPGPPMIRGAFSSSVASAAEAYTYAPPSGSPGRNGPILR